MTEQSKPASKREPWHPAKYEDRHIYAIKALLRGDATPDQQKFAMEWIVQSAAMTHEQSFYPKDPLVTAFVEGRRSVGLQIIKLANLKVQSKRGDIV